MHKDVNIVCKCANVPTVLIGCCWHIEFKAPSCNNKRGLWHCCWSLGHGTPSCVEEKSKVSCVNRAYFAFDVNATFPVAMAQTTVNLDDERRQTGKTVFTAADFSDLTTQQITDAKETFLDLESYWRRFRFEIDSLKENHRGEVRRIAYSL